MMKELYYLAPPKLVVKIRHWSQHLNPHLLTPNIGDHCKRRTSAQESHTQERVR